MRIKILILGLVIVSFILFSGCIKQEKVSHEPVTVGFTKIEIIESSIRYLPRVRGMALTFAIRNKANASAKEFITINSIEMEGDCKKAIYYRYHIYPQESRFIWADECRELKENEKFEIELQVNYTHFVAKAGSYARKLVNERGVVEGIVRLYVPNTPILEKRASGFVNLIVPEDSIKYSGNSLEFLILNNLTQSAKLMEVSIGGIGVSCGSPLFAPKTLDPKGSFKVKSPQCIPLPEGSPFIFDVKIDYVAKISGTIKRRRSVGYLTGTAKT